MPILPTTCAPPCCAMTKPPSTSSGCSSCSLGERLSQCPIIVIGPRKPRVRGPGTVLPCPPRRGRAVLCASEIGDRALALPRESVSGESAKITAVLRRRPARQVVRSQALKFCRTCVPNVPISLPENSSDSGEPFPGPELKPRHRKSGTLYGVG